VLTSYATILFGDTLKKNIKSHRLRPALGLDTLHHYHHDHHDHDHHYHHDHHHHHHHRHHHIQY